MTLPSGLRGSNGQIAAPPYTNGPYTWDQDLTFSGAVTIANLTVLGTLTFGDAALDSLILKGRMSTGTAAGSAIDLGTTYTYGEAIELRYTVSNWTGIGSSFKALYLRSEADLGGSYGLRCAELYGVMDTSTTTGLSNLQVLYTEMLVKASASNRTLTAGNSIEANISIENQTGTLTLTNNIYCLYAKAQTGTGLADYTKVCGVKIAGRDDGTARVFGTALDISDPEATVAKWTKGISITTICTTGISLSYVGNGAASKAITTAGFTLNNGNLTDGVGAIEADLTLTGTVAGHVSALSSWINMVSVTTGSNYICAQSNGLYSAVGGVLTNGVFIFGMRAQCLLQTNGGAGGAKFYPFSVVNNTNITTAIFKCNAGSSDLGTTAVSKTTEGKYVPLYEDDAGVHYVLIYN